MFNDLIGVPFVNGGRDKTGVDCWGLVIEVFKRYGIDLPDYKISCEEAISIDGKIQEEKIKWQRFDAPPTVPSLVVIRFNSAEFCNHTGVYIGQGLFIHTRIKVGVNIDRIDSPAWRRIIEGYYVLR